MIEVEDLRFFYPLEKSPAIDGISFSVARSEIYGFLGPSGAGKSTTQKILIGLLKGYQGKVSVLHKDVRDWHSSYYESIGVSFELPNHHLRLTALENLKHFAALYSGPVLDPIEVLDWVGLKDAANKRVQAFSKGMKIRLNVARSLLHDPKILFLDEPTSGLDPVNAQKMRNLILRLCSEGTTVFLTTHDMFLAEQLCSRVAFLADGQIKATGQPEALKRQYGRKEVVVTYIAEESGEEIKATFPLDDIGNNSTFLQLLKTHNIKTIHSQESTLADVFIQVTGQALHS